MESNYSGFSGYGIASLYPNYGTKLNQTADTIPEDEEQQAYSAVDDVAPPPVEAKSKKNMLYIVAGIGAVIVVAALAKG